MTRFLDETKRGWFLEVLREAKQKILRNDQDSNGQNRLSRIILNQIAWKVGGISFNLRDVDELQDCIYSIIDVGEDDIGWFTQLYSVHGLVSDISATADNCILLAISKVLECEVRIFQAAKEVKVIEEGKTNRFFGILEFNVKTDGQIGNIDRFETNQDSDQGLNGLNRIVTQISNNNTDLEKGLTIRRDEKWYTGISNWIFEIENTIMDDGKLHSALVRNVFQQMETGRLEVREVEEMMEWIDQFFEEN